MKLLHDIRVRHVGDPTDDQKLIFVMFVRYMGWIPPFSVRNGQVFHGSYGLSNSDYGYCLNVAKKNGYTVEEFQYDWLVE